MKLSMKMAVMMDDICFDTDVDNVEFFVNKKFHKLMLHFNCQIFLVIHRDVCTRLLASNEKSFQLCQTHVKLN